jgi:hypothetical protein
MGIHEQEDPIRAVSYLDCCGLLSWCYAIDCFVSEQEEFWYLCLKWIVFRRIWRLADKMAFGPFVRNVGSTSPSGKVFASGVVEDLMEALEVDGHNIAAFMIEPIQGSAAYARTPS